MSFYLHKAAKLQPFVLGLVGYKHKLQNTANHNQAPDGVRVIDESTFKREKRVKDTRRILATYLKETRYPGISVAISVNGKEVFKEGLGMQDIENGTKVTEEMRSNIASVSKLFTAYLIMKMFQDNKFKASIDENGKEKKIYLQTPIQHHGIIDKRDKHQFSLADLMLHKADMMHYSSRESLNTIAFETLEQAWKSKYRYLGPWDRNFVFYPPYTNLRSRYSSLGIDVLGVYLEICTGESFLNILTSELRRLGLRDTCLHVREDVMLDFHRGYIDCKNLEEGWDDSDRTRFKVKRIWQIRDKYEGVLDYEHVNPNPAFHTAIFNSSYVDFSMKYASEGLIGNVGDLIKFGNLFLRMDQDLTGGKPLSASLTKVMWSYTGDYEDPEAEEDVDHFRSPVIRMKSRCLGWRVETLLHEDHNDKGNERRRYRTIAEHDGNAVGCTSMLYITFMKEDVDYSSIVEYDFAPNVLLYPAPEYVMPSIYTCSKNSQHQRQPARRYSSRSEQSSRRSMRSDSYISDNTIRDNSPFDLEEFLNRMKLDDDDDNDDDDDYDNVYYPDDSEDENMPPVKMRKKSNEPRRGSSNEEDPCSTDERNKKDEGKKRRKKQRKKQRPVKPPSFTDDDSNERSWRPNKKQRTYDDSDATSEDEQFKLAQRITIRIDPPKDAQPSTSHQRLSTDEDYDEYDSKREIYKQYQPGPVQTHKSFRKPVAPDDGIADIENDSDEEGVQLPSDYDDDWDELERLWMKEDLQKLSPFKRPAYRDTTSSESNPDKEGRRLAENAKKKRNIRELMNAKKKDKQEQLKGNHVDIDVEKRTKRRHDSDSDWEEGTRKRKTLRTPTPELPDDLYDSYLLRLVRKEAKRIRQQEIEKKRKTPPKLEKSQINDAGRQRHQQQVRGIVVALLCNIATIHFDDLHKQLTDLYLEDIE